MMDYTIRPVRPSDAAGIVELLNPIIAAGSYTVLDAPLTVAYEAAYIEDYPRRGVWMVAVSSAGRVLGLQDIAPYADYSAALDHVGVVGTFVDLAQRRQGIGRRLAQATFAAARDAGYEKLFASIRADNPAAQRYYGSLGFTTVGIARRQARFRQGDGWRYVDEILVELWL